MNAELGTRLRSAREARRLSLGAASGEARISPAYLHKLEAGGVNAPSPPVLMRLGSALGVDYWALMEAAGYVPDRPPPPTSPTKEEAVPQPTNAEILKLLAELRKEVAELRRLVERDSRA